MWHRRFILLLLMLLLGILWANDFASCHETDGEGESSSTTTTTREDTTTTTTTTLLRHILNLLGPMETRLYTLSQTIFNLPIIVKQAIQSALEMFKEDLAETCKVHPSSIYDKLIQDPEGFYLAFRLTAGIGQSAYDRYRQTGVNDDDNDLVYHGVPCACKSTNGSLYCGLHYRSVLMDLWPRLPVDKVKVSLFKAGVEKRRFVFDGKNSDSLSFFRQARLREDDYADLSSFEPHNRPPNYFSIEGDGPGDRRFFINNVYPGCAKDQGWLVVGDRPIVACHWEDRHKGQTPFIMYASTQSPHRSSTGQYYYTKALYQSGKVEMADVLTVSIKLREPGQCHKEDL